MQVALKMYCIHDTWNIPCKIQSVVTVTLLVLWIVVIVAVVVATTIVYKAMV